MTEKNRLRSTSITRIGCVLVFLLLLGGLLLTGIVVSRVGIGIIGKADQESPSPVGVWKGKANRNVMQINLDGTGRLRRHGRDEYFEWRLDGDEFGIYQFSKAEGIGAFINRIMRGLGLQGDRAHSNFKLVNATSNKLTLALDDEPHPDSGYKLGDHVEYEAIFDETEVTNNE